MNGQNKQNCNVSATCLPKMATEGSSLSSSSTIQHQFGEYAHNFFILVSKSHIYLSLCFKMFLGVWMTQPMGEMCHLDAKLNLLKSILGFQPCFKTGFNFIYH